MGTHYYKLQKCWTEINQKWKVEFEKIEEEKRFKKDLRKIKSGWKKKFG